ncbi:MAG: hypothetical protein COA97_06240 [Flavobacteriales bacterium]|nr:MAG: hypothetical protein COA97_06240 [Flavobacteriales bacterium]
MKSWSVTLKLASLTVLEKIEFARSVVTNMTGNKLFSDPTPALDIITTLADELQVAYAASRDAGKEETRAMHNKEFELKTQLTALGCYVQVIANNDSADGADGGEIILSAGMDFKQTSPRQDQVFTVSNAALSGFIVLTSKSEGRASYVWEYSLDQENWAQGSVTTKAESTISGLTRGELYFFRVAAIVNDVQEAWQGPISLTVT